MSTMRRGTSDPDSRGRWLAGIGVLMLLAGLVVGGIALAAPLGVWFGAWPWNRGFDLLRTAHGWGPTVAFTGLGVAVVLGVVGRLLVGQLLLLPVVLALTGGAAAALAWYVPESHRPPAEVSIPPIHDISTDTVDPPRFVDVLPLRADAANTVDYGNYPNMTPERLGDLTREAYPDLTTRHLTLEPAAAFERALAAVNALGWDLVAQVPAEGRIEATDTTFWFRFRDDIVIRIRPSGDGGSLVDARSTSRVGVSDVGTNARRLRAFFDRVGD